MKKLVLLTLSATFAMAVVLVCETDTANAIPPIKKAFDAKYVKPDTPLAAAVKVAKCNVCHINKKPKKMRNAYGMALSKYVTKKDGKDLDKINAALDKVAAMNSKEGDKDSPTFGDLIKSGKLPATE